MKISQSPHSFHIPVMGLGFTLETPVKVAQYGISSAVSVMDDNLLEHMRIIISRKFGLSYEPVPQYAEDERAEKIRLFLNVLNEVVNKQMQDIKSQADHFSKTFKRYINLLPDDHECRQLYETLKLETGNAKKVVKKRLLELIQPGKIDVNIMTKIDKINYDKEGNELPRTHSDALSALRGFAKSDLESAVVFSAGLNPVLYSYVESFPDFFPDENGKIKKSIILKVSDYRSALIQGKYFAKKGLWVSEFRIESGLNCGGHAFATEGLLIGPILETFKYNRENLSSELFEICQQALKTKGYHPLPIGLSPCITYQGGIGNAIEQKFLMDYYKLNSTGWGSPFLMVPEATNVDEETLQQLVNAKRSDFYLSNASPLGIPFNNLRNSSSEVQRLQRVNKNRPGSPCYKKLLSFNTEFSDKPICTASREYQNLKLKQLEDENAPQQEIDSILEKDCLCEGLGAPAILSNGEIPKRKLKAVAICPGPNLAYFKGVYSLEQMVDHIYGRASIDLDADRPNVFVKELQLYIRYLINQTLKPAGDRPQKHYDYLERFRKNLAAGIQYYEELIDSDKSGDQLFVQSLRDQLGKVKTEFNQTVIPIMEPI